MQLQLWVFFENMISGKSASTNAFERIIALAWIMMLMGGPRFAHFQRSQLVQLFPAFAVFVCSLGKSKSHGRRRPFYWAIPRYGLYFQGEIVSTFLQLVSGSGTSSKPCGSATAYLLPDFGPNGCSMGRADRLTGHLMPIQRFHALTRDFLSFYPEVAELASSTTTYSARRLFPTIADAVQMAGDKRKDLGHWKGSKELAANQQNTQMADRYSEARSFSQALTRRQLIEHVRTACQACGKTKAFSSEDWPSLLIKSASLQKCEDLARDHFRKCQDLPSVSQDELAKSTALLKVAKDADSSDSSSSGSNISSSVQSGSDSSEEEAKHSAAIPSSASGSKTHWLATRRPEVVELAKEALKKASQFSWCTAEGSLHLWSFDHMACNSKADHSNFKAGLSSSVSFSEPWCKVCLSKLPHPVQRAVEVLAAVEI
jgi:hypothetical protein